ncbi:hypothetical protein [Methanococcoides sp. FTZ1]
MNNHYTAIPATIEMYSDGDAHAESESSSKEVPTLKDMWKLKIMDTQ